MFLITKGALINAKPFEEGWTPLHYAAREGQAQVVEVLIARGAEIDARDNQGMTPLHWAAERGQHELAGLLIDAGANMTARDSEGGHLESGRR